MNEPFGALDGCIRRKDSRGPLCSLKEAGKSILIVTHGVHKAVFPGTWAEVPTAGPAKMADNFVTGLAYSRALDTNTQEAFGADTRHVH
jgi:NitT/TauT family transport system ATP-binding protein